MNVKAALSSDDLARACADAMWKEDDASKGLGMEILQIGPGQATLTMSDLKLNPDTHEVTRAARQIDLTQREFELLEYLMRNERIVISRQRLLDEVWGYDPFSMTNTIEVFVSNLRRKLEAGGEPRLLHTIRGAGYVLRV